MLDIALIVRRRHELALSHRAVARHLGVSAGTVKTLEEGSNHADLPLRLLVRLAEILAVEPAQLLRTAETADSSKDGRGCRVATLGALLGSVQKPVAVEALAEACETTLAETEVLLGRLAVRLRRCGLELHRPSGCVQIVAGSGGRPGEALRQLLRGQHVRAGMGSSDAELLHRVYAGTLDPTALNRPEQVTFARLLNAGLVCTDGRVLEEVAFSLAHDSAAS